MKLSYQLFKNADGTWRAEIPFPGRKNGISIHQTGTKDRAKAEKAAKRRCHRLPIEDKAHKRHTEKRRAELGKSGPVKIGRPRKVEPLPPPIDPTVAAAKLKALPIDSGAGPVEPEAPPPPPPEPAPESPSAPPAEPLPPLPEPAPPPITPEIGDDRPPDPDAEGNEFFADVAATAVVAGTIKICHSFAEKRGKKANEPSPKAIQWYTEGLQFRFRALMGNAALTPTTKLLVGAGGVILSMLWGAPDLDGRTPNPEQASQKNESRAPSGPPTEPERQDRTDDHEHWQEPAPLQLGGNGYGGAASGKFR